MRSGQDTTASTIFVSPNFPNSYPANTTLVQTFSPPSRGVKLQVDFSALLLPTGTLSVYDGADTTAPLLGKFSGLYGLQTNPSLVATNPSGQLTFHFSNGDTVGKFGWIAHIYSQSVIRSYTPQMATTGDTVIINGQGFYNVEAVRFGQVSAASYQVISDSVIKAVVATGSSGQVQVVVAGRPLQADGFTYYANLFSCAGTTQHLSANAPDRATSGR
jgi:hypothetical protein